MLDGFLHLFARRSPFELLADGLDLFVVSYTIYRILLLLRGTRALQIMAGLSVLVLLYLFAQWAQLVILFTLLSTLLSSSVLILVVVFQSDIRRALAQVGESAWFSPRTQGQEARLLDEVVAAVTELATRRIGALLCFEQRAPLEEFVVGHGIDLDALVRRELLVNLFCPIGLNKLHDGAVVIQGMRLAKAGVFFPMSTIQELDQSLGSRHRAAIGITEETDAVVVVVSEERGSISLCAQGVFLTDLDSATLRQHLANLLGQRSSGAKDKVRTIPPVYTVREAIPAPVADLSNG